MNNNLIFFPFCLRFSFINRFHPSIKIITFASLLVFVLKLPINIAFNNDSSFFFANYKIFLFYGFLLFSLIYICFAFGFSFRYFWQKIKGLRFFFLFSLLINLTSCHASNNLNEYIFSKLRLGPIFIIALSNGYALGLFLGCILFYNFTKKKVTFKLTYFLFLIFLIFVTPCYLSFGLQKYSYDLKIVSFFRTFLIMIRLLIIFLLFFLFTKTTSFIEIQDGLEIILSPLKKIKISTETFTLMLSLIFMANSFLLQETSKILKAQTARGMDLNKKNIFKRINHLLALLVPVFVLVFKRSLVLSNAMEIKGYVLGASRTKINIYHFKTIDFLIIFFIVILYFLVVLK